MPEVRVQAIFTLAPGDGENKAVNTFHFTTEDLSFELAASSCLTAVSAFYTAPPQGAAAALGANMATTVLRVAELRAYDMTIPPPRQPVIQVMTLPAGIGTPSTMPMDVAACLSYTGAPPVTGRKRGRIFIPGIHQNWMVPGSPTAVPLFDITANTPADILARAGSALRDSPLAQWCIRSMATGVAVYTPIVAGYVDSEPDTQRRRGLGSAAPRRVMPA